MWLYTVGVRRQYVEMIRRRAASRGEATVGEPQLRRADLGDLSEVTRQAKGTLQSPVTSQTLHHLSQYSKYQHFHQMVFQQILKVEMFQFFKKLIVLCVMSCQMSRVNMCLFIILRSQLVIKLLHCLIVF